MAAAYPPSSSSSSSSALPHRGAGNKSSPAPSNAPQGTFLPGTKVQVGGQRVTIEKYLSEGGFAHVYVVRVPRDGHKHELAVLKRVAVPDRDHLASMRTEVETMKKLKGHRHVVTYMDSHASQLKAGGYEVFLLMEYCSGGGLIDFMNTRLQHRLTEPEILKIFGDVAEGLACMHYLKPPLLHRDLKVENVLIGKSLSSGTPTYKLCDFGSAAQPRPAPKTAEEGRLIEEDVHKHTTMQYRSPEMIDVWRKQPIDEKADVWALGVLLYKLCYYTTPFEAVGQMAILNATYKFPSYPSFSERLKKLIGTLLKENPKHRPTIYQVIKEVCSMRGKEVPIKDIYAQRTQSEARRNESLPSPELPMSLGLQKQAPQIQVESIPDIAPMRRGRPIAPAQGAAVAAKPSPSPARGDPFAALDSKNYEARAGAVDELSTRFPSLDEFSIAHEKSGEKFSFPREAPRKSTDAPSSNLDERVTNALADEVFKLPTPKPQMSKAQTTKQSHQTKSLPSKSTDVKGKARDIPQQSPLIHQPTPVKTGSRYTSTGVGSSPPPVVARKFPEINSRPFWKVPDHHRSSSQPKASESAESAASTLHPSLPSTQGPTLLDLHRSNSQTATLTASMSPTSSRPSLEGHRPPHMDLGEPSLSRAKSAQSRPRPSSAYVSSNLDYLRDQETTRKRPSMEARRHSRPSSHGRDAPMEETNIDDDMDYLRRSEDHERRSSRKSSGHKKRASIPSISSAKNIFAGRFGDAFKRFENKTGDETAVEAGHVTPEPRTGYDEPLSPIDGSQPTPSKHSDAASTIDETEDLPPDMRRELERRRLSQEERRVEAAAAEYRARVATQGTGGAAASTKASTIQRRVQSLLDETQQAPLQQKRTAEGYGRDVENPESQSGPSQDSVPGVSKAVPPPLARKPPITSDTSNNPYPKTRQQPSDPPTPSIPIPPASAPPSHPSAPQARVVPRPSVPPKSSALRTGGGKPQWPASQSDFQKPQPPKPSGGLAALLAKDLEGVPDYPPRGSSAQAARSRDSDATPSNAQLLHPNRAADEDLEEEFGKRYPSLSAIEMVETEIGGQSGMMSMKEV